MLAKTKAVLAATALILAGGANLAVTQPASAAKKYTGCVNKSTGEMRILLGKPKKCQKGWKKVTWTKAAPKGDKGAAGKSGQSNSFGAVLDANGATVGRLLGFFPIGFPLFIIQVDGGVYSYTANGWLIPSSAVYYDNAACTGQPFVTATSVTARDAMVADPSFRVVYRRVVPTLGAATAYKSAGTSSSVLGLTRWSLEADGTCAVQPPYTGFRIPLTPITAPPDHPGPLQIG